jgi:hypothetical protein
VQGLTHTWAVISASRTCATKVGFWYLRFVMTSPMRADYTPARSATYAGKGVQLLTQAGTAVMSDSLTCATKVGFSYLRFAMRLPPTSEKMHLIFE